MVKDEVILAFGSNKAGQAGGPIEVLEAAVAALSQQGVSFVEISSLYLTPASGVCYQPAFYNFVARCKTAHHPEKLLKLLKRLERQAGRRGGLFWGPRPLDIDIIDFQSKIKGWSGFLRRDGKNFGDYRKVKGRSFMTRTVKARYGQAKVSALCYPHREMHRRGFVLLPLSEIAPHWRHPVFGLEVKVLMQHYCSPLELQSIERLEKSVKL